MQGSPTLLLSKRFSNFEELAELAVAWRLDFRQVSRNYSDTLLEQIQAGNILVSHLLCGCFSTHTGETPSDMLTFALPDPGTSEFRYAGCRIDRPALIVTRPAQEFEIIARPGYGITTFSIPRTVLENCCGSQFEQQMANILDSRNGVVFIAPEKFSGLRQVASKLSRYGRLTRDRSSRTKSNECCESAILAQLSKVIESAEHSKTNPVPTKQARTFKRALKYIGDHQHEYLPMGELAAAVNRSERTIERTFNNELGVTPRKYISADRMYEAYRELYHLKPGEKSVADVANDWGFWHMGQFAKDYRKLFGELPSETLVRST